jgi:hypothetical protein
MEFDPTVWGPHYWFFLHTIAHSYPETPNEVTKRKYYDTIQNMPLFIPDSDIGDRFSQLLDKYPVSPYLGSRESFVRWVHFIHNKINVLLGKDEMSLLESVDAYFAEYRAKPIIFSEVTGIRKHYLYAAIILICLVLIYLYS